MFDLIVAGAGPAGSCAAITAARQGASVLLLEGGQFPRQKVCGEFVSGESIGSLSRLLQAHSEEMLHRAPRIRQARIFCDGFVLRAEIDPAAASIARFDLDAALFQTAKASGVDARERTRVKSVEGGGAFTVTTDRENYRARAVINASGRWSSLNASAHTIKSVRHKWLGVKAHFKEESQPYSTDLYFFEGGYCGVQPVTLQEDRHTSRINVCAMVRPDISSTLGRIFEQNRALSQRSRSWRLLTEPVSTSPLIFRQPQPTNGSVLSVGDAAGFVDPFVGDGLSLAFRSGEMAARSLVPFFEGRISLEEAATCYRQTYERDLLPVFRTSSKVRALFLLPRAVRILFLAGIQRSPALMRYVVRHTR